MLFNTVPLKADSVVSVPQTQVVSFRSIVMTLCVLIIHSYIQVLSTSKFLHGCFTVAMTV